MRKSCTTLNFIIIINVHNYYGVRAACKKIQCTKMAQLCSSICQILHEEKN